MIHNNWLALLLTLAVSFVWLKFCDLLVSRKLVSSQVSRKIIHIGTGPIYVLCWFLFDQTASARWMAAVVPAIITLKFLAVGKGWIKSDSDVQAMSRSGDRRELLRGPLFYGFVFVLLTLFFWRDSPVGITALMILCAGDGAADLVGSRWGKSSPIPWSQKKSWHGSAAMFGVSLVAVAGMLLLYRMVPNTTVFVNYSLPRIALICLLSTFTETIDVRGYDNLTVPLIAVISGLLLFTI